MAKLRSAPTLDDVAKMAGVSTATVSRCLNDPDRVVEATRERVQSAVDALGYTPNFAARVMAAKRSFTIGAIIPTMEKTQFLPVAFRHFRKNCTSADIPCWCPVQSTNLRSRKNRFEP